MNELLEKVRGVSRLPLFPLPVVLFPGTPLPLHIFEPRYQQMLRDISIGNRLFGLSFFDASAQESSIPEIGHFGCAAEVREVEELPDGRSNIVTFGIARYEMTGFAESDEPYLIGEVEFFSDFEEDKEFLEGKQAEVSEIFRRIGGAIKILTNERGALPELPETSPEQFSFLVAAAIDFDSGIKQELFQMRRTSERLDRLKEILRRAAGEFEDRAEIHQVSKTNGHSKKKINLDEYPADGDEN